LFIGVNLKSINPKFNIAMKTFKILAVLYIFLLSTSFVNAQQDSTTYKVKLEKFQTKARNGKITTITGLSLIGVDLLCAIPMWDNEAYHYIGASLAGAGLITTIVGASNWSIGKKKVKEYKIRLDDARSGFYFSPNQVGLKLTFKF
jgi:hypothetical protein